MAELSEFLTNMDVMRNGVWITVGVEPDTFEIKTRGMTNDYRDELNRLRREAAREVNRGLRPGELLADPNNLPPTLDDRCQAGAIAKCLLDVRGLTSGGQPVAVEAFCAIIAQPQGRMLLGYALGAAAQVAEEAKLEQDAALGNSSPA